MPSGAFTSLTKPGPAAVGRFAQVGDAAAVNWREDVLRMIAEMRNDLAGTGAGEWENPKPERFLEAVQGFLTNSTAITPTAKEPPANPTRACSPPH